MVELTLKWAKFGLSQALHSMMENQELVDVTVMCEGQFIQAHKSVLSASSEQFKQIFKSAQDKYPIVVLRGINAAHFKNILQFMYLGEVTVRQDDLQEFIATADELGVSCLAKNTSGVSSSQIPQPESISNADLPPVASTQSRRGRGTLPTPVKFPTADNQRHETVAETESVVMSTDEIKEEVVVEDDNDDWTGIPSMDLDSNDTNSSGTHVVQSVQACYGVDNRNDPGPSTSQGGTPWTEGSSPAFQGTNRPIKRKISHSPTPSAENSDNDDEPPQSDSSASQENPLGNLNNVSTSPAPPDIMLKCSRCSLRFSSIRAREHHEFNIHYKVGSLAKCDICNKVFVTNTQLNDHRLNCKPQDLPPHVCQTCGLKFSLERDLRLHVHNVHETLAMSLKCNFCFKSYKNQIALKFHHLACHKNI